LVVRFLFVHPKLDRYVEGEAMELVRNGRVLHKNMRRELITEDELRSRARVQGIEDLRTVKCARIEVGGALTFVPQHPTPEQKWDAEIRERLTRIEASLAALSAKR
jgi:uncharacterized membrane protein YcaP (DUF421 family)